MAEPAPSETEAFYDEAVRARLDRGARQLVSRHRRARPVGWRRGAVTGTIVTGLVWGLQEVFDPPPDEVVEEEIDLSGLVLNDRAVTFVLFDGAPQASRIVVRPWLASI